MHRRLWMLAAAALLSACHCENAATSDTEVDGMDGSSSDAATSTWGASGVLPSGSSEESTGAPFDASRWLGRYHFETPFLPFGERGDPLGTYVLTNFEILEDSTASMFYDACSFEEPVHIAYTWEPSTDGWLSLHPGPGEPSLRFQSIVNIETLRVHLIEPCRALEFEADGTILPWTPFHPGASCWIDRCTTGNIMHVDYCEGEEPPPCP
jgi:hypothetical protein